jgi:hypothetical protein
METVQAVLSAETVAQPDQLEMSDPSAGAAVRVTVAPLAALPLQLAVLPLVQLMSGSLSVVDTVPVPVPAVLAVSV